MACKCESVHRAGGEAANSCKFTVVSEEAREKLVAGDPSLVAVQPGWNNPVATKGVRK
jgi:hypothetical protein